jgi:hypothetical protein
MVVLKSLTQNEYKLELGIDFFVFNQVVNLTLYSYFQDELTNTDITPFLIVQ